jgi:hypothetical protein
MVSNLRLNKEQEENMLAVHGTYSNWYRSMRVPILSAFDIYKTNVTYGIDTETEEEKEEILEWYINILRLERVAFENVPNKIRRYL